MKVEKSEKQMLTIIKKETESFDVIAIGDLLNRIADIKEKWNKTVGFYDERTLDRNRNDFIALRRAAKIIEKS